MPDPIFNAVLAAMQQAEELGGPSPREYRELMYRIAEEALVRARTAAELSYYTVIVPWSDRPTKWHPTESRGPFSQLSRGIFKTEEDACDWATLHLGGQPYFVKLVDR